MKNKIIFIFLISIAFLGAANFAFADYVVGGISVQTNSATSVYNNSATLNGYFSNPIYGSYSSYVWFQYGPTTSYGSETSHQLLNGGAFSQNISNLSYNTIYHFRAVAQNNNQIVYGQDTTFYTSGSGYYYGLGQLSVSKKVINLTSGTSSWQTSVNANPLDVLSFAIILQSNQDVQNVFVRDILPANLIYSGALMLNTSTNYAGDIASGINVGTVYANQPVVISYHAQVASAPNFSYGITTLNNSAIVTNNSYQQNQIVTASVFVNRAQVQGVTNIPTGITNDPVKDSFFLPVFLIILMSWFYFSGSAYRFADWLGKYM